jgi:hypothetical protein
MKENDYKNFIVYPNPAQNQITIELAEFRNGATVEITNMLGQLMAKTSARDKKVNVDVSGYKGGVYFVKVISGNKSFSRKLIID